VCTRRPSLPYVSNPYTRNESCSLNIPQVLSQKTPFWRSWSPKSLRYGVWNNTWRNWGYIAFAFLIVYGIEAGYFAGLLFASQRIRQQTYRALPTQYFGDFIRTANVYPQFPVESSGEEVVFNPPKGCSEGERAVLGFPDYTEPDGIQTCPPTKGQVNWSIFPWVSDSNGLGQFPGCASAGNDTVITYQSNPAYTGEGVASGDWQSQICQNFVFTNSTVA
jgi:hypothetical protein